MSLFDRLGRKFEELKREAESASKERATHRCENCESLLYAQHDECPECGSDAVVELDV